MSIATMKRKTAAKYNNMSVGAPNGFSLNGTHRSQGYVGQSTQSRSLPTTLMKGNVIRGHGGCCGTYPIHPIVQSAVRSTEDSTVVKSSVVNTSGMLSTQYRWIRRPQPFATVKPDVNRHTGDQSTHIHRLEQKTLSEVAACTGTTKPVKDCHPCKALDAKAFTQNILSVKDAHHVTKPIEEHVAISQGDYLLKLDKKCGLLDDAKRIPSAVRKIPFACGSSSTAK